MKKIIKIMRAMKSKFFRRVRLTSVFGKPKNITLTDKIKPKCAECTTGKKNDQRWRRLVPQFHS